MPNNPIATDSARELHNRIGDDATATFESDPNFVNSNPTGNASTENVTVQRDTDDTEDSDDEEDDEETDEEDEEEEIDEDEDEDDDEDDIDPGVDEDDLDDDDMDTDQVAALASVG